MSVYTGLLPQRGPSREVIQNPTSQQVKTGPPITLAFQQFEPIHLTFYLSLRMGQREGCGHGSKVAYNAAGKADQFGDPTVAHRQEPVVQVDRGTGAHHPAKVVGEGMSQCDPRTRLTQGMAVGSLRLGHFLDWTSKIHRACRERSGAA